MIILWKQSGYTFRVFYLERKQWKDITMNICIQIRAVVDLIQEQMQVSFEEANIFT